MQMIENNHKAEVSQPRKYSVLHTPRKIRLALLKPLYLNFKSTLKKSASVAIFQNYMGIVVKSKLKVRERRFQWIWCLCYFFSLKLADNFNMYFHFWLLIPKWCFSITDHYNIRNNTYNISVNSFAAMRSIHDQKKRQFFIWNKTCHSLFRLSHRVYKVKIQVVVSCSVIWIFKENIKEDTLSLLNSLYLLVLVTF